MLKGLIHLYKKEQFLKRNLPTWCALQGLLSPFPDLSGTVSPKLDTQCSVGRVWRGQEQLQYILSATVTLKVKRSQSSGEV